MHQDCARTVGIIDIGQGVSIGPHFAIHAIINSKLTTGMMPDKLTDDPCTSIPLKAPPKMPSMAVFSPRPMSNGAL
jgi:hypothetical protein